MEINVKQDSIQACDADTIIVNLFEGVTTPGGATGAVDAALDGAISELIASGDFRGKGGEVAVLYPREPSGRGACSSPGWAAPINSIWSRCAVQPARLSRKRAR